MNDDDYSDDGVTEHEAVFDSVEEAFASWVKDAGGVERRSVWVTPAQSVVCLLPKQAPPSILVSRLLRDPATDQYFAKAMNWPFLMRLTNLPRRLRLPFEERVIRRLIIAGFVKGAVLTPGCYLVDVESLDAHLRAVSGEDGLLFWTPQRRERYREAINLDRRGSEKRRDRSTNRGKTESMNEAEVKNLVQNVRAAIPGFGVSFLVSQGEAH